MSQPAKELPKDLAGYQHVVCGPIMEGDIWVVDGIPAAFISQNLYGVEASEPHLFGFANIYRKMPVAKQGDCDDTGWKKIRDAALKDAIDNEHQKKAKALTHDDGKPPLARLPWKALNEMAKVQAYGYGKYRSWDNWKKGMEVSRNASCALRHIRDYMEGADKDHESGCHPLAHAMIRLAYIIQNELEGTAVDDRSEATGSGRSEATTHETA